MKNFYDINTENLIFEFSYVHEYSGGGALDVIEEIQNYSMQLYESRISILNEQENLYKLIMEQMYNCVDYDFYTEGVASAIKDFFMSIINKILELLSRLKDFLFGNSKNGKVIEQKADSVIQKVKIKDNGKTSNSTSLLVGGAAEQPKLKITVERFAYPNRYKIDLVNDCEDHISERVHRFGNIFRSLHTRSIEIEDKSSPKALPDNGLDDNETTQFKEKVNDEIKNLVEYNKIVTFSDYMRLVSDFKKQQQLVPKCISKITEIEKAITTLKKEVSSIDSKMRSRTDSDNEKAVNAVMKEARHLVVQCQSLCSYVSKYYHDADLVIKDTVRQCTISFQKLLENKKAIES